MPKENLHSIVDSPLFEPWTTENWFDENGLLHSRDLYLTQIRLKKGALESFSTNLLDFSAKEEPYFLEFYTSLGYKMSAEVRGFFPPAWQEPNFDRINLLIGFTPDQLPLVFPDDSVSKEFGY